MPGDNKRVNLTLDAEMNRRVLEYQNAVGIDSKVAACKDLMAQALSSGLPDASILSARQCAITEVRSWMFSRLRTALIEIIKEIELRGGV